jgi:hypothetical protein
LLPETIVLFGLFREVNKPLQFDCIAIAHAKKFTHPPLPDVWPAPELLEHFQVSA